MVLEMIDIVVVINIIWKKKFDLSEWLVLLVCELISVLNEGN